MKNVSGVVLFSVLFFAVVSCRLADRFTGGGKDMTRAGDLWSDVPRMDSLSQSDLEMPLTVKLLMRTALNNLWRFDKEGDGKAAATGDWIVFASSKMPSDVRAFYTNERMTSFGRWDPSKNSTCVDGNDKGINGVLCLFGKQADRKQIGLAIVAMQDEDKRLTNIFFLRIEKDVESTVSANQSNTTADTKQPRGPITDLKGPAPYGVERRPKPTGLDLDQLLPRQVGTYTRATLEKSDQRGSVPSSIEMDGNSVYATYRDGSREIFVEFAMSATAEDAQATLDVAAGDTGEAFPTDPRKGSIGTEPSYLMVDNESGAFFAWTRGGYYFSANAKGGKADLDAFMNSFPY